MNQPLYQTIVDAILLSIKSGDIKVGNRFPPESDYAEQLGVSRSTLRAAFSQLEHQGIIQRRKRGGTEVIADKPVQRFQMMANGPSHVLTIGNETEIVIDSLDYVSACDVEVLVEYESVSEQWLRVAGCRFLPNTDCAFAYSYGYVPMDFADLNLMENQRISTIYSVIAERYNMPMVHIVQNITAVGCSRFAAPSIGLQTGDPVLNALARLENKDGEIMIIANTLIDSARYTVINDISVDA